MLGDRGREPAKSAAWAPLTADCARRGGAESGSQRLSGEPELLARGCDARVRDDDGALEDLGAEEGLHQLVVGAVAEHLGLDVGVLVLAGDLAHPAARVVANDEYDELGVVTTRFGEDGELRAGLGGDKRAQRAADA